MKAKCIIVDDEPLARKGMQEYIGQIDFLELVGVFESATQVYPVLDELEVDLIFLDINMPEISGIEFIRSLKNAPLTIFTTAYPNYALEGFELDVVDYLVKPISLARFMKAVNKAKQILEVKHAGKLSEKANDHFFVKEEGKYTKIFYKDVLYAQALQNYVVIFLQSRKLITYITMSILEKQFPAALFLRIHKSYIISLEKINSIEGNTVVVQSARIPVSRKVKDILLQKVLENKLLKR